MVFSRYAATSNEGGLMKKAIPLVMSALMATSFTGVPAIAQAKTPAARTASEKQETQCDLSNCDLRQRNYRSNFIEGNGPDNSPSKNCLKRDIGKKQARVFPPKREATLFMRLRQKTANTQAKLTARASVL